MNIPRLRNSRVLRRRLADKLILALWPLGALFATTALVRAEGTTDISAGHAGTHVEERT